MYNKQVVLGVSVWLSVGCSQFAVAPLPGHPVMMANGKFRIPDFASCTIWGFTQTEFSNVQAAIDSWEEATDETVTVDLTSEQSYHCEIYPLRLCPEKQGNTHADINMIQIALDMECAGEINQKELAMHELGHAFGLGHASSGLMNANHWTKPCVDEVTLGNFCNVHFCSPGAKSNCK